MSGIKDWKTKTSEVAEIMVPMAPRAVLFVVAVMAATSPVQWQFHIVFPSEPDRPNLSLAAPATTMRLMKYEAAGSPHVQTAMVKAAAGRKERSNTLPDVLTSLELNEAHIKYKLSNILRALGIRTGSQGLDLARSGILLQILERVRADDLAKQLTNKFRIGTTDGGTPQSEGGDRQEKDYGEDEEVAEDDTDDQGKSRMMNAHMGK